MTKKPPKSTLNEALLGRVRDALAGLKRVEEKRMFGGLMFMVNGAMCLGVREESADVPHGSRRA